MMIHNGDHAQFEIEHANTKPEDRPDWPLPSFDARDWAKAWMKVYDRTPDEKVQEDWMVTWFASALMRGYDRGSDRVAVLEEALRCLLPGLILDLRYADVDDDKDAMRSRIETVETALGKGTAL